MATSNINNSAKRRAIPIIAKAVAHSMGVKVVFENSHELEARTDGKTIYLPTSLPAYGDEDMTVILEGLLDHEAAHVRFTEFDEIGKMKTAFGRKLLNVLEDPRIENRLPRFYPGTKENLRKTASYLKDYFSFDDKCSPASTLTGWLITRMRSDFLGQDAITPIADQWEAHAEKVFTRPVMDELYPMALNAADQGSTRECRLAAEAIIEKIKHLIQQDEENQKKQGSGSGQGQGQGQNQGQGQGQGQSSGQGSGQGQNQSQGNGQGQNPQSGTGSGAGSGLGKVLQEVLDAQDSDIRDFADTTNHLIGDLASNNSTGNIEADSVVDSYKAHKGRFVPSPQCLQGTRLVGNRLDALLQSRSLTSAHNARSGRLAPRRLAGLASGRCDVFDKVDYAPGLNTAVKCTVDRSGSMSQIMTVAKDASGIVAESLHKFNVPFELAAFDEAVYPIKNFSENWLVVGRRLNMVSANGGTHMGNATHNAFEALINRTEERKIFLLVTDGDPSSWDALHVSVSEALRYGVEVRAVIIGSKAAAQRFQQRVPVQSCSVAENAQELPFAIFESLRGGFV